VKYEKIPRFCAKCGFRGHEQEECGSRVHDPSDVMFGKWLLADTPWNRAKLHGDVPRYQRRSQDKNIEGGQVFSLSMRAS
jgi:hypothetical protein